MKFSGNINTGPNFGDVLILEDLGKIKDFPEDLIKQPIVLCNHVLSLPINYRWKSPELCSSKASTTSALLVNHLTQEAFF